MERPSYGEINLDVIREVASEARRLCVVVDRQVAGSDLAKTLGNCDRLLRFMSQEIDRLRAVNADLLAACERFEALDIDPHATEAEWSEFRRQLNAAIAKVRAAGGSEGTA